MKTIILAVIILGAWHHAAACAKTKSLSGEGWFIGLLAAIIMSLVGIAFVVYAHSS